MQSVAQGKMNNGFDMSVFSMSHDLQAPLRRITGFSKALLEDFQDKLDAKGLHYLQQIHKSTRQMELLIEDMLRLANVDADGLKIQEVNLSRMAREIASELFEGHLGTNRRVEFAIADGITVSGDNRLLRLAMHNLLENAWKYTGKKEFAVIEFGAVVKGKRRVCFVRDNGAGFDKSRAKGMFGIFQRFHSASEYAGTGIGLATVQRIIHRHGGSVWAEGEVGAGATFYFTLSD